MFGYMGKILYVDLSTGAFRSEALDEKILRQYVGGNGLAVWLYSQYPIEDLDALDPRSPLFFMTGPFVGTTVPCSGRYAVCGKSPLTGIWGDSDSGGSWGVSLKGAGYDAVVITGRSETPVSLYIG